MGKALRTWKCEGWETVQRLETSGATHTSDDWAKLKTAKKAKPAKPVEPHDQNSFLGPMVEQLTTALEHTDDLVLMGIEDFVVQIQALASQREVDVKIYIGSLRRQPKHDNFSGTQGTTGWLMGSRANETFTIPREQLLDMLGPSPNPRSSSSWTSSRSRVDSRVLAK